MSVRIIKPQPGPQTRFSESPADILVFGGEGGGGKSYILVYEAGKWKHVPGYRAILFRRTTPELTKPGGLWDKARMLYTPMGGDLVQYIARWPTETSDLGLSGSEIHLSHLQNEGDELLHDGSEYAFVGFDEGQYFTERMIWYLWGRCRTLCGVKPYMRITCNPDPDCYLRTLLDWWIDPVTGFPIPERDGVIRWAVRFNEALVWFDSKAEADAYTEQIKASAPDNPEIQYIKPISIQFIRSRLKDNPALLAEDPEYGARLAMQDADTRAKKLGGNWNSRPKPGEMFNRAWFGFLDKLPNKDQIAHTVRGWDKAASIPSEANPDPDWTVGVKMHRLKNGQAIIADVVRARLTPGGVDGLIKATAELDGPEVEQAFWTDPGQAGLVDEDHNRALLTGISPKITFVKEVKDKIAYAKPVSAFADPETGPGKIWLLRAAWNGPYLSELEGFPDKAKKKDQVDATSRAWLAVKDLKSKTLNKFAKAMARIKT